MTSYRRGVVELFPFREGSIGVARFRCRRTGRTVSYLPFQLAPFFRYSVRTIVLSLLLVAELRDSPGASLWGILEELPPQSDATSWLLRTWLVALLRALRRAHAVLAGSYDLSGISSACDAAAGWHEVASYGAVMWRGPPRGRAIRRALWRYSHETEHHFLGTPSQERGQLRSKPLFASG